MQKLSFLASIAAGLILFACGGDDDSDNTETEEDTTQQEDTSDVGSDITPDTQPDTTPEVEEDTGPEAPTCERRDFTSEYSETVATNDIIKFVTTNNLEYPRDLVFMDLWRGSDFDNVGTFELDPDATLQSCHLCILSQTGCTEEGCEHTYFANEGFVDITNIGEVGDQLEMDLSNVVFTEVRFTEEEEMIPVVDGDSFCFDAQIDEEILRDPAKIDQAVYEFELQSCDTGEMVSFTDEMIGAAGAWLVMTAGWCSACRSWVPQVIDQETALAEEGVEIIYVLGEDQNGEEPTLAYCRRYAAEYEGSDVTRFYLDHNGTSGYSTVFQNLYYYPDEEGAFGLPLNMMVKNGTPMIYIYNDTPSSHDVEGGLERLLEE